MCVCLCVWVFLFACTICLGRYAHVASHPTVSPRHPKPAPTSVVANPPPFPKPPPGGVFALRPLNEQAGPLHAQGGGMQRMAGGWTWPWKVVPSVSTPVSSSGREVFVAMLRKSRFADWWWGSLCAGSQCWRGAAARWRHGVDVVGECVNTCEFMNILIY